MMDDVLAQADNVETVYTRGDRAILRWRGPDSATVIVKVRMRPGLKHLMRRHLRLDAASYEWRSMRRLQRAGVRVPVPLGTYRVPKNDLDITDVLFMEDLGPCEYVFDHMKDLIKRGDEEGLSRVNQAVLDMTAELLQAGIVDTDHSLRNIVRPRNGELVRLDLEMARIVPSPRLVPRLYARMLGRLLASFTFVFQPDVPRVRKFAAALAARLRPPKGVRDGAQARLDGMLEAQTRGGGPEMRIPDVWSGGRDKGQV